MVSVVCFLIASVPWSFGPYQNQAYLLSRELDRLGYKTRWMSFTTHYPEREYKSVEEFRAASPESIVYEPVPSGYNLTHLRFLGKAAHDKTTKVSHLNRLAKRYGIDAYIILTDISSHIIRDADFQVTAIGWLPSHYDIATPTEVFTYKAFTHIAPLAPTSMDLFKGKLKPLFVHHIPHIIEVDTVESLEGKPTEETPVEMSVPPGTFVVLFQGGNYDSGDRKGIDVAIQAFERFHAVHPNSVLLFHSIGTIAVASNDHYNVTPPVNLREKGVPLHMRLALTNMSESAYRIETRILPLHSVFAFKRMANVCFHPSKTEGFGMNMMECQAVGTPVITTRFLAMGDFTRYGVSVPYRQTEHFHMSTVAQPDVEGVTDALFKAYRGEGPEFSPERRAETQQWIAQNFSSRRVGNLFHKMLQLKQTKSILKARAKPDRKMYTLIDQDPPPVVDIDTIWVLCTKPGVVLQEKEINMLLLEHDSERASVSVVPIPTKRLADQTDIPTKTPDGAVNPELPYLMPTYVFLGMQAQAKTMAEIAVRAFNTVPGALVFPQGLATI